MSCSKQTWRPQDTPISFGLFLLITLFSGAAQTQEIIVEPAGYPRALRNPLKGFTSGSEWETLRHTYIRWNEIENHESDGIEKIRRFCDQQWQGFAEQNIKAIPRVYLHWEKPGEHFWPADMTAGDYTSDQFKSRVQRLIGRLGQCWNNDPRVAFIELGIFGKWGEHHSPDPTPQMQEVVGTAFAQAFPDKLVSVRHPWIQFKGHSFGAYWDSWSHHQQMWPHGNEIAKLNATGLWRKNYIGGECAYNWGQWHIQPGRSPTESVSVTVHRDHVINTIRWLHGTQLKWIANYDEKNPAAVEGAMQIQKALGYRLVIDEARFSIAGKTLSVALQVTNEGSAPFYYDWPLEISLLDENTRRPVWQKRFEDVDIRRWLPGDGWTEPTWRPYDDWPGKVGDWTGVQPGWQTPPKSNSVKGRFEVDVPAGTYILALAILDPAGNLPSVRFATTNYINGGRHPIGTVAIGEGRSAALPRDFQFDDPHEDTSLHYVAD